MSFPWLDRTSQQPGGADRRAQVAADEITQRAATLYRLGFSEADAVTRLQARVSWEYDETPGHPRPDLLSDAAIAKLVSSSYARKPG